MRSAHVYHLRNEDGKYGSKGQEKDDIEFYMHTKRQGDEILMFALTNNCLGPVP